MEISKKDLKIGTILVEEFNNLLYKQSYYKPFIYMILQTDHPNELYSCIIIQESEYYRMEQFEIYNFRFTTMRNDKIIAE